VKYAILRAGLVKNRMFWYFKLQNLSLSLPLPEAEGDFSDIYCKALVELLEVNITKLCCPRSFSLTDMFHTETPTICPLRFQFFYPATVSMEVSTHGFPVL
jgi:hypothetical protein